MEKSVGLMNVLTELIAIIPRSFDSLAKPAFDQIGEALADKFMLIRRRNQEAVLRKVIPQLTETQIHQAVISPTFLARAMDACGFAEEPRIQGMWARLIASSATDPKAQHPAFISILQQLSVDEAKIIEYLKEDCIGCTTRQVWDNKTHSPIAPAQITDISFPTAQLAFPQQFEMYIMRLMNSYDLATWRKHTADVKKIGDGSQQVESTKETIELTVFGQCFVEACIGVPAIVRATRRPDYVAPGSNTE